MYGAHIVLACSAKRKEAIPAMYHQLYLNTVKSSQQMLSHTHYVNLKLALLEDCFARRFCYKWQNYKTS